MATAETDLVEVEAEEEKLHALWSATSAAREAISLEIAVDATGIDEVATETATGIDEIEAEIEVEIVAEIAAAQETAEVRETEIVVAREIGDLIEAETGAGTNLVIDPAIEAVKRREDTKRGKNRAYFIKFLNLIFLLKSIQVFIESQFSFVFFLQK